MKKTKLTLIVLFVLFFLSTRAVALDQSSNIQYHLEVIDKTLKTTPIHRHVSDIDAPRQFTELGLNFSVGFGSDILEASIIGGGLSYSNDDSYEMAGEISWNPVPRISFTGGYKVFALDPTREDISLNNKSIGPYVEMELSF